MAKYCIMEIFKLLTPKERFCVTIFDENAETIFPFQFVEKIDIKNLEIKFFKSKIEQAQTL